MNQEQDLLFDDYLNGSLDDEARLLFESKFATDAKFASDFKVHRLLTNAIAAEKEARLRSILEEQRRETFIGNNAWGKKFTMWSAAIVLFGLIGLVFSVYRNFNPYGSGGRSAKTNKEEESSSMAQENTLDALDSLNNKTLVIGTDSLLPEAEPRLAIAQIEDDMEEDLMPELQDEDVVQTEDIAVSSDEILGTKTLLVTEKVLPIQKTELGLSTTQIPESAKKNAPKIEASEAQGARNKETNQRESKDTDERDAGEPVKVTSVPQKTLEKAAPPPKPAVKNLEVLTTFLKSPLNYKGYYFDDENNTLSIYGLQMEKASLLKYNGVLYLKSEAKFYKLLPNTVFSRFIAVSDKNIINILNQ